ncbi:hypothetical protein, partial [Paraburkholderia bryophila]|uniref:hypothetical protein n=1 Tax=Paraburkholderia bryophila TaxID=420952 RepID=UPI0015947FB5
MANAHRAASATAPRVVTTANVVHSAAHGRAQAVRLKAAHVATVRFATIAKAVIVRASVANAHRAASATVPRVVTTANVVRSAAHVVTVRFATIATVVIVRASVANAHRAATAHRVSLKAPVIEANAAHPTVAKAHRAASVTAPRVVTTANVV